MDKHKNLLTVLRKGCTIGMSLQKHDFPPRFYEALEISVVNLVGENITEVSVSRENVSNVEQIFDIIDDKIAETALDKLFENR